MRRIVFICLSLLAQPVAALHIERIDGAGWSLQDLRIELSLATGDARGSITLAELQLPEPFGQPRQLRFDCDPMVFTAQRIACEDAKLTADWALLDQPQAIADVEYLAASGALRLHLKGLAALGGHLSLDFDLKAADWQATAEFKQLAANRLAPLLAATGQALTADAGSASGRLKARGDEAQLMLDYSLSLQGLTAYDEAGDLASENLDFKLSGAASPYREGWRTQLQLTIPAGQVYVNPVFLDATGKPLAVGARLHYFPLAGSLLFDDLRLTHTDTLALEAEGGISLKPGIALHTLRARLERADMLAAYPVYLQPFLLGTGLDELETAGRLSGSVQFTAGAMQALAVQLEEVTAHDAGERFTLDAVSGALNWQADKPSVSQLRWAGGSAYQLPFEAGELRLQSQGASLNLTQPLRLGLLGGALNINKLAVEDMGSEAMQLAFDGGLEPLSLTELTRALGWPEFDGTLAGQLPDLSYHDGQLTVGGTLAAEVFDGKVAVNGLRIDDPFGRLPRLAADIRVQNLDLQKATSAFSFGAIEGRLDGEVNGLRLLNWQPVAFDARLYTPKGDRSPHRISQRAIENISSLGGAGATAALSRGFMRFFENFAYDRLGIACRLANGVCRMGGIEDAPDKGGYYLVKGRLLPRIDVIGYANEVSWPALMEQLRSISEGSGPEVR